MTAKWQFEFDNVKARDDHLLKTGLWSDIIFVVGSDQICMKAHKLNMAKASPVFESMFYGEGVDPAPETTAMPDLEPDVFRALLRYIYTDATTLETFDMACKLCRVASKYELPHLVKACLAYINKTKINTENAINIYEFAKEFDDTDLLKKSMNVICQRTNDVLSDVDIIDVKFSTLIAIFEQDELNIDSELDLCDAAVAYKRAHADASMRDVIEKIRFLTLTPEQFSEGPATAELLTQSECFTILTNISTYRTDVLMPDGFSTSTIIRNQQQLRSTLLHCKRKIGNESNWYNIEGHCCHVSFNVDSRSTILGIQIPAQCGSIGELYHEHICISLWCITDRKTLDECTIKPCVPYNTLHDAYFDKACIIEKDKQYMINVRLYKAGHYPIPETAASELNIGKLKIKFHVNFNYDLRTGFIRSVILKKMT